MRQLTIQDLQTAILKKGYKWLDDGKQDNLNIIGIRSESEIVNQFNDLIFVVFKGLGEDGKLVDVMLPMTATTKPGTYWLNNPGSVQKGTAILTPGQYLDSWALGMHQGKYEALTQIKSVKVYRDKDRDSKFDFTNIEESGLVGINIHRANIAKESVQVDKWSAGCQVIANPDKFATLIRLVKSSVKIRGNKFSYTLLEESDLD